jgi:thiamine biosynthesis protein ThiI
MNDFLIVHYSEIGTKGRNRSFFERRLMEDLRARLSPDQVQKVRLEQARVVAELAPGHSREVVTERMARVFGTAWFCFAQKIDKDLETLKAAALAAAQAAGAAKTFKIYCHRVDKTFPYSSQAVCIALGDWVRENTALTVDLEHHDWAFYIEILPSGIYIFTGKNEGLRGMPAQSAGRMLGLFSGGIDSPVAVWHMMRRGAIVDLIHFHPFRTGEEVLESKIAGLYKVIRQFEPRTRLYLVPHYPYQVRALDISPSFETVFFRRFMLKVSEALARQRRMKALVTGDSLGQVASQTLDNLAAAQRNLDVPVFSPLIASDKDAIVRTAEKIGTYALSIEPYKDCCSLLTRKPKTTIKVEKIEELEAKCDIIGMVEEALTLCQMWDGETLTLLPANPKIVIPAKAGIQP